MRNLSSKARSYARALQPTVLLDHREANLRGISRRQLHLSRAWNLHLLPDLDILTDGLLVDVGAHEGLWTRDVLELAPKAQVIAVEPQNDLREVIESRFAGDSRVTADSRALSDSEGTRPFHLLGASVNASLHEPRTGMNQLYGKGWETESVVSVETTTVDQLVGGRDVALLKINVQGAEAEVLAGASETLGTTDAVMQEVTFVSHYENENDGTFPSLHQTMRDAGFSLASIAEPARSPRGMMLCADACYVSNRLLEGLVAAE